MDCPQCHGPFKDPTTFPCGHSCCIEEAKQMGTCVVCNEKFIHKNIKVNYFMRDIISKLRSKLFEDSSNNSDLLPFLECPICFVPYIDPTTFPCGHSCCLAEAKELSSCPICNARLPSKLSLNVSLNAMIENLCKSEVVETSAAIDHKVVNTAEDNDSNDEDEMDTDAGEKEIVNSSNSNGDKKKKKRKNRKKKKITDELIADLFYQARYFKNNESRKRLEQLSESNNLLAMGFACELSLDKLEQREAQLNTANKLIPLLEPGVLKNDKYYLYLSGLMHYILQNAVRGLQLLKRAADMAYGPAQYTIGHFLQIIHKDTPKAIQWFKKAADQGVPEAQYDYGRLVEIHYKNKADCFKYFKIAADQGHEEAQRCVAECYSGVMRGFPTNKAEAVRYWTMAAEQGNPRAQRNLSVCYSDGIGCIRNIQKSMMYLKLSADQNDKEALFNIAQCYIRGIRGFPLDEEKGYDCLLKSSMLGNEQAISTVGKCTKEIYECSNDNNIRITLIKANEGDAESQYVVGAAYSLGEPLEQNDDLAFKFSKLAADQGYVDAGVIVGDCYWKGKGVAANNEKAFKYFKMASDAGVIDGHYYLALCYLDGIGVEVDQHLGFKLAKLAADENHEKSFMVVARCYYQGIGVEKNEEEGLRYMKMMCNDLSQEDIDKAKLQLNNTTFSDTL